MERIMSLKWTYVSYEIKTKCYKKRFVVVSHPFNIIADRYTDIIHLSRYLLCCDTAARMSNSGQMMPKFGHFHDNLSK